LVLQGRVLYLGVTTASGERVHRGFSKVHIFSMQNAASRKYYRDAGRRGHAPACETYLVLVYQAHPEGWRE